MKRKKIKSVWKEYLTLSMRERRGLSILLGILLSQLILLICLNNTDLEFPFADQSVVNKLYSEFSSVDKNIPSDLKEYKLTVFDPNEIDLEKWMSFGLSEKQANSVLNYRRKGGVFRTKKDVKKIYGMNDELYLLLLPFIDLPDSVILQNSFAKKTVKKSEQKILLDINKADSVDLEKLKGIGFTLAARIVKYRERLGGYIELSQLKEVWGLNDTLYRILCTQIVLKGGDIKYLHLNTDSSSVFSAHPYIGKKLAAMIVNYRIQHNGFDGPEDLRKLPLLTDENFRKLAPYLKSD